MERITIEYDGRRGLYTIYQNGGAWYTNDRPYLQRWMYYRLAEGYRRQGNVHGGLVGEYVKES